VARRTCYCDGITRRDLLQVGAMGVLGWTLGDLLRMQEASADAAGGASPGDRSAIFLWLSGGPSHIDTWDPKPGAPAEIRGTFQPIKTNVAGIEIADQLPLMAQQMDKVALVRSVTHNLAAHSPGSLFMQTGNRPTASLRYPTYGAVLTKEKPAPRGVPPFVSLPNTNLDVADAGYLGVAYNTYTVGADPNAKNFNVRSLTMPAGITLERLENRRKLAADLDTMFRTVDNRPDIIAGMDSFYQQAYDIIRAPKTRAAFDLSQEPDSLRDLYGRTTFGQSCLLARRLVEAGVRIVQVNSTGWDTHAKNFDSLQNKLLPAFDRGFAALMQDLHQRGLAANTVVLCTGEFGRTPKINKTAGRDHWSKAMSVLLGGAGVRAGQVLGATNANAEEPVDRPVSPEDIATTFYRLLGVDAQKEYLSPSGRPVAIVREGKVVPELMV
jgi:Protein of unknown function (DUF1501)